MIQRPDHQAGVLTCQFICSLPHVDWFKLVLAPELKQLFCDSERGTNVVDWRWPTLTQLLKNRLEMLLGLEFLFLKFRGCGLLFLDFFLSELICLIRELLISVCQLPFIVLD